MRLLGVVAIVMSGILLVGPSTAGSAGRRSTASDRLYIVVHGGVHVVLTDARGRTSGDCDTTGVRIPACEYVADARLFAAHWTEKRRVMFTLGPPYPGRYRLSAEVADSGGVFVECAWQSAGGGGTSAGGLPAEIGTRGVWSIQWSPGSHGKPSTLQSRRIEPPETPRARSPRH
jgi:hypothetical protein